MRYLLLSIFAAALNQAALVHADIKSEEDLRKEIGILKEQMQELGIVVKEQSREIEKLKREAGTSSVSAVQAQPLAQAPAVPAKTVAARRGLTPYLPEIGVVGDMVATSSRTLEDEGVNDRLSVREVEVVFGSDIDPYARLDATLSFSDLEEAELEEAYASYWGLPAELKGRIGRFHQRIGKAAQIHRDSLDTVDEPLVVQRYFGEHGIHQTGLDIEGFTPLSGDTFTQQLTLGVMEGGMGHGGTLFGSSGSKPSLYGHLANFWEFGDADSFEIGGTYLLGANQLDQSFKVNALGLDATYLHHLTAQQKLKLQGEFFVQNRRAGHEHEDEHEEEHELSALRHTHEADLEEEADEDLLYDSNSRGFYALADYRFALRWGLGARYDWVQPIELMEDYTRSQEQAYSAYLSFYQSEFARWRLQYQRALLLDGENDDRFFLQGTFAIGTHKHQLQ